MCKIQIKKNWIAVSENADSFTIRTTSIKETASRSRSSRSTTFQIVAYQTNSTSNLTLSLWISTCVDLFAYWILISSTTRSAFTNDPSPFDVSVSTSHENAAFTTFFQLANKTGMTHFQVWMGRQHERVFVDINRRHFGDFVGNQIHWVIECAATEIHVMRRNLPFIGSERRAWWRVETDNASKRNIWTTFEML